MASAHRVSHVGSWLRPAELKEQRTAFFQQKLSGEELRKSEDRFIADVVKEQQNANLKVRPAGRSSPQIQWLTSVDP